MKRMWSKNELKQQNNANAIELLGSGQVPSIKGDEIIENMSGYSFTQAGAQENLTKEYVYVGVVKNGNKLTLVVAINLTRTDTYALSNVSLGTFTIPSDVASKLYPTNVGGYNFLDNKVIPAFKDHSNKVDIYAFAQKDTNNIVVALDNGQINNLTLNAKHYIRYEITFLLSDNLVA